MHPPTNEPFIDRGEPLPRSYAENCIVAMVRDPQHIYAYWDCVLDKNGATPAGYPWKDPAYKGSVEYSRDMCPRTLDILGRALRLHFHMNTTEKHVRLIATAINKVDAALA